MRTLLERIRELNRLIQNTAGHPIDFFKMAQLLSKSFHTNIYIITKKGKVVGSAWMEGFDCEYLNQHYAASLQEGNAIFPDSISSFLLQDNEPRTNVNKTHCVFRGKDTSCYMGSKYSNIIPILGGGQRLGTLLCCGIQPSTNDDLVLGEYAAAIIGMEMLRSEIKATEKIARQKAIIDIALDALSYSELEAVEQVFKELNYKDGLLIASKIADKVGITRSVIVNALRKLESAGIVEARSLGMKGTYVHIANEYLVDYLEKINIKKQ